MAGNGDGRDPEARRFLVTGALGAIGVWTMRSLLTRGCAVVALDVGGDGHRLRLALDEDQAGAVVHVRADITDLDAVERVLDSLKALGDRAQPTRQALDVGGGGNAEGPHRRLLCLGGLLARGERARERAGHHRVARQLLGHPPERLLALAREAIYEPPLLFATGGHCAERSGALEVLRTVDTSINV